MKRRPRILAQDSAFSKADARTGSGSCGEQKHRDQRNKYVNLDARDRSKMRRWRACTRKANYLPCQRGSLVAAAVAQWIVYAYSTIRASRANVLQSNGNGESILCSMKQCRCRVVCRVLTVE